MCLFLQFNGILNFAVKRLLQTSATYKQTAESTSALSAHQTMCADCKQTQHHAASTFTRNKTEKYQSNTFPNLTVQCKVKLFIREPRQQQQSNTTVTKSNIQNCCPISNNYKWYRAASGLC